jgi:DNA-binding NarL/FixJ family response regulator
MAAVIATIAEAGRGLAAGDVSIDSALGSVLDATGADRVSLSAIDEAAASFELLAARGGWLLAPGTRFPTSVSTHFLHAGENSTFVGGNLARDRRFVRPVDQLVLAHGFGAGACMPVRHARGAPGALAIHFRRSGSEAHAAVPVVEPLLAPLSIALARLRRLVPLDILVCHSDALVARGLAHLLGERPGASVRICHSRVDAAHIAAAGPPDVVVADNTLEGVRVDRWFGDLQGPCAKLLPTLVIVASHDSADNRACALAAGARAYVARASAGETLLAAIDSVSGGDSWLPRPAEREPGPALTARELEVLRRLDVGLRLREIALDLEISHATVKAHVRNVFSKLGAGSRAEATYVARAEGLLPSAERTMAEIGRKGENARVR